MKPEVEKFNEDLQSTDSKYPISFHGCLRELEQKRGFKKYIFNLCRAIGYEIVQHNLSDSEIEVLYINTSQCIRNCLKKNGEINMSLLDQILQEFQGDITEGQKVIEFCRKMQEQEYEKNPEWWQTPEIKQRFKNTEYILKILINQDDFGANVCCLSKDLLSDTFHMTLFNWDINDKTGMFRQKSKIVIYDDMNGEKPPKSKEVITKFLIKLKDLLSRF